MLEPTKQILSAGRLILASGSPRRKEIIENLGLKAEIIPSTYDENLDRADYTSHGKYVEQLARLKVLEVFDRLASDPIRPSLIIGADTLVTMDDVIYGKPKDADDAHRILSKLSGKTHIVYTGVCLKAPTKEVTFHEAAEVTFGELIEAQIKAYVDTGEPLDKAGGYGIQGFGGALVERINGDFFTVMGLPLYSLTKRLNEMFNQYNSP